MEPIQIIHGILSGVDNYAISCACECLERKKPWVGWPEAKRYFELKAKKEEQIG